MNNTIINNLSESPSILSDEQCMELFQCSGNSRYINELSRRYTGPALGVARQFFRNSTLAEDAVQEAFIKIIRKAKLYSSAQLFGPWFYKILRNICIDLSRKEQKYSSLIERFTFEPKMTCSSVECAYQEKQQQKFLLKHLPVQEQVVLDLRINQGMNFSEIAAACGTSVEAAKKRAQRGLKKLKNILEKSEHDTDYNLNKNESRVQVN